MTADPVAIVKRADRRCLQDLMRELAELDTLMRESWTMPPAPEPVPLHRNRRNAGGEGKR